MVMHSFSPGGTRIQPQLVQADGTDATVGETRTETTVRYICTALFFTAALQVLCGIWVFSLVTSLYGTRRGSWWSGICPLAMFWMSRQGFSSHLDRKHLLVVTIIATGSAIAGAVVDADQLGHNISMQWCQSGAGTIYMSDGTKFDNTAAASSNDSEQLRRLNQCMALDLAKYQEAPPKDVCVCAQEAPPGWELVYRTSSSCLERFQLANSNTCAMMHTYGPVLAFCTASNVFTCCCGGVIAFLLWKSMKKIISMDLPPKDADAADGAETGNNAAGGGKAGKKSQWSAVPFDGYIYY